MDAAAFSGMEIFRSRAWWRNISIPIGFGMDDYRIVCDHAQVRWACDCLDSTVVGVSIVLF